MSTVNGVSSTPTSAPTKENKGILGKDDFLRILVTQLQHQDPMEPLQDREFIAQMAQFSTVEQISNMAQYQKLTYESLSGLNGITSSIGFLSSMIDKEVEWTSEEGTTQTGIVTGIRMSKGESFVEVGENLLPLGEIVRVGVPK